ncbi:hypothetical protein CC86DRAFT_381985 [Ophiobolus disseminans]|uniref:Uncharacterized protein n=1 Tax=Ophiobolus disseminans TaxID=1469910 RepID=A0A6A7A0Z6_9PLEO|nr:hypothetical protein CC86DRAFT_381985 [Ophiobolus disseminans]
MTVAERSPRRKPVSTRDAMTQANIAFCAEDDDVAVVPLLEWSNRAPPRHEQLRHHSAFLFWNTSKVFVRSNPVSWLDTQAVETNRRPARMPSDPRCWSRRLKCLQRCLSAARKRGQGFLTHKLFLHATYAARLHQGVSTAMSPLRRELRTKTGWSTAERHDVKGAFKRLLCSHVRRTIGGGPALSKSGWLGFFSSLPVTPPFSR